MDMRVWDYLGDYLKDDTGATAIEYGILAAGLAALFTGAGGITDEGVAGAALVIALVADTESIPTVVKTV